MIKKGKIKIAKFNTDDMVGVLKNWFPEKDSVDIIRDIRESVEL